MAEVKNIIFDIGGVLIDWDPLILAKEFIKNYPNVSLDISNFSKTNAVSDYDRGLIDSNQLIKFATKELVKFTEYDVSNFFDYYTNQLATKKEAKLLFYQLKKAGYKIYLLSNFSNHLMDRCMKKYDYYFMNDSDGAIISYQVQSIKPEPKIFQTLLQSYHLKAEECLFIDDMKINIDAAKNLGFLGIECKNIYQVQRDLEFLHVLQKSHDSTFEANL